MCISLKEYKNVCALYSMWDAHITYLQMRHMET